LSKTEKQQTILTSNADNIQKAIEESKREAEELEKNLVKQAMELSKKENSKFYEELIEKARQLSIEQNIQEYPFVLISNENLKELKVWLSNSNSINFTGQEKHLQSTLLGWACFNGKTNIVKWLIELGADVNQPNSKKESPIHVCCHLQNQELIELLLDKGARIDIQDSSGKNPIEIARIKGNKKIIELLSNQDPFRLVRNGKFEQLKKWAIPFNNKTVVNLRNPRDDNSTLLHTAIDCGREDIVDWLLRLGADVNTKNDVCDTALHIACFKNSKSMIRKILNSKPDKTAKNIHGQTPAARTPDPEIWRLVFQ